MYVCKRCHRYTKPEDVRKCPKCGNPVCKICAEIIKNGSTCCNHDSECYWDNMIKWCIIIVLILIICFMIFYKGIHAY